MRTLHRKNIESRRVSQNDQIFDFRKKPMPDELLTMLEDYIASCYTNEFATERDFKKESLFFIFKYELNSIAGEERESIIQSIRVSVLKKANFNAIDILELDETSHKIDEITIATEYGESCLKESFVMDSCLSDNIEYEDYLGNELEDTEINNQLWDLIELHEEYIEDQLGFFRVEYLNEMQSIPEKERDQISKYFENDNPRFNYISHLY
jgi:hypothetical protein